MWAHRADGIAGYEGWIDADASRAWAREALARFRASREASSTADAKREWRAGWVALNNATAALNLTDRAGAGIINDGFPFGLARLDINADQAARDRARAGAIALAGSADRLNDWALSHRDGDTWYTAADGSRFGVRVYDYPGTGERSWGLLPDPAAVLAFRRSMPVTQVEERAAAIVADPWQAYIARRREIDATNARNARLWGLTTDEEIAGFQLAADEVNRTLGAEWESKQRAAVQRQADAILDRVSQYAAATGVGAPIAAIFQALKIFTGILPWATEEAPPPALSRVRTGGVSDRPTDRPTHTVPRAPAEPLEAVTTMSATVAEYRGPSSTGTPSSSKGPTLRRLPNLAPSAVAGLLGGAQGTGGGLVVSGSSSIEAGAQGTGGASASSSSGASSSNTTAVVVVLGAAGLLWWATR